MCGICGIVDMAGQDRADPEIVRALNQRIRHRGPDGEGFYAARNIALGMRRLSIIDIAGSDQPLTNEDHSIALVFNGEIYNYRELRDQLVRDGHTLRTEGDGETIVHLYEQHGLEVFSRLRGMYAFALWDARRERLVLAVDHIGMKPLYLHEQDGRLLFASEVKAFFADSSVRPALNLDVVDTFLSFGYMIGDETLFEGIRRLPPGHALVVEKGGTRLHRHWHLPDPADAPSRVSPAEEGRVISRARELLEESVHLHLRSDVPLGLFLSGGIDSAAILALMAREASGRIKTFTIGYATETRDNELLQARRTADYFGTDHHERVINAEDWWSGLQNYVYAHDEPNANPSAVSLQILSEDTARQVKVVLTGLGGDELFGGYLHHQSIPWALHANERWAWLSPLGHVLGALEPYYPAFKRFRYIGALPTYLPRLRHALLSPDEGLLRMQMFDGMVFSDSLRARLYSPELLAAWRRARHKEQTYQTILKHSLRGDAYDTAQALVIHTWLTGNALLSQDKTSMAHSLEARVPFFDPVLLEFAAEVPPGIRMRGNKYVLREAMRPYLPDFALERPKQGFGTPIVNWFGEALRARIEGVLLDHEALARRLFQPRTLERLLAAHFAGRENHVEVIFRLLTLELWAGRFEIAPTSLTAPSHRG